MKFEYKGGALKTQALLRLFGAIWNSFTCVICLTLDYFDLDTEDNMKYSVTNKDSCCYLSENQTVLQKTGSQDTVKIGGCFLNALVVGRVELTVNIDRIDYLLRTTTK